MAVLVVVVAVLVVSYASSMRAYLQQRAHINDLHAQIDTSERDIKALEREKRRWQDDAYVETQARERFGWVMPGEEPNCRCVWRAVIPGFSGLSNQSFDLRRVLSILGIFLLSRLPPERRLGIQVEARP